MGEPSVGMQIDKNVTIQITDITYQYDSLSTPLSVLTGSILRVTATTKQHIKEIIFHAN